MGNFKQRIIQIILDYIAKHDGSYPNYNQWYIGITSNPRRRLFEEHNVDERNGVWIWEPAQTSSEAREIESYFTDELNTDGGGGGGDYTTKIVYAYRKTGYTIESA